MSDAPPPRPAADDTPLVGAQSGMPIPPPPGPSLAASDEGPAARRAIPGAPVLWIVPLLLLLALAVWAARRGGESAPAADPAPLESTR